MAKLTTASRKALPGKVFCGPNRSYPAHDRSHAQNCLARGAQHGAGSKTIACCRKKLKQFGGKPGK